MGDFDQLLSKVCMSPGSVAGENAAAEITRMMQAKDAEIVRLNEQITEFNRWLSKGVYFTTAEYEKHVAEHRQQVEALQAQVKRLSTCGTDHSTPWWQVRCEDLEEQLSQLQALVRAYGQFGEILQREATYKHWDEKNGRYTLAKVLKWWREMREGNTNDSPGQMPAV